MKGFGLVLLLVFIDFPISFGVQHVLGCMLNAPDKLIGGLSVALTVFVNLCITMLKLK